MQLVLDTSAAGGAIASVVNCERNDVCSDMFEVDAVANYLF